MCKVILKKDNQNIDFIIYNILFATSNYCFTTDKLLETIRNYDAHVSRRTIQVKIDTLISAGLVRQRVGMYCTTV